jgi:hypothetical protein
LTAFAPTAEIKGTYAALQPKWQARKTLLAKVTTENSLNAKAMTLLKSSKETTPEIAGFLDIAGD